MNKTLFMVMTWHVLSLVACGDTDIHQSQEQEVVITQDQLGSVEGTVLFRIGAEPSATTLAYAGVMNSPGAPADCRINGCEWNDYIRCQGYYLARYPAQVRVSFSYQGSSTLKKACAESPTCQYYGSATVSSSGQFSISNLLVGSYEFTPEPSEFRLGFEVDSTGDCVIEENSQYMQVRDLDVKAKGRVAEQSVGKNSVVEVFYKTKAPENDVNECSSLDEIKCY